MQFLVSTIMSAILLQLLATTAFELEEPLTNKARIHILSQFQAHVLETHNGRLSEGFESLRLQGPLTDNFYLPLQKKVRRHVDKKLVSHIGPPGYQGHDHKDNFIIIRGCEGAPPTPVDYEMSITDHIRLRSTSSVC